MNDLSGTEQNENSPRPAGSNGHLPAGRTQKDKRVMLRGQKDRISSTIDLLNHEEAVGDDANNALALQADATRHRLHRISQTNPRNTIENEADEQQYGHGPATWQPAGVVAESKGLSRLRAQIQCSLKKNNFLDSHQNNHRGFRGNKNGGGNASSPSLPHQPEEGSGPNVEEPLTERFIKDENFTSKPNSVRQHPYEHAQIEGAAAYAYGNAYTT